MDAVKAFEAVKQSAEKIQTDKPQRFPEAASVGDYFRQGDLYVNLLAGVGGLTKAEKQNPQLAPGTTKGSRHILDSLDGVTVFNRSGDALTGPTIKLEKERVVTHPEHGNLILPPGCYGITYQRAFAQELRRVMD